MFAGLGLALTVTGCGGPEAGSQAVADLKAALGVDLPTRRALALTGVTKAAGATELSTLRIFQASSGKAPGYPAFQQAVPRVQKGDQTLLATELAAPLMSLSEAEMATQLLGNLGISSRFVASDSAITALQDAVETILQGCRKACLPQLMVNASNLLAGLEADATWGAAASAFNRQTQAAYAYSSNPVNMVAQSLAYPAAAASTASAGSSDAAPSTREALRFLAQATFGPTAAELATLQVSSLSAWIDQQMAMPMASPSHQQHIDNRVVDLTTVNANQFYESWWRQAVTSPDQLRQRMAFALSQIFVISLVDSRIDTRGAASYYDTLARNAFGNFRTLLDDVTRHPMMGLYLTSLGNQKEAADGSRTPDENYAREVMQLFTIGLFKLNADGTVVTDGSGTPVPSYDQSDIKGLAKVFTGMSWYSPSPTATTFGGGNAHSDRTIRPMSLYSAFHSTSAKSFLGVTIPASSSANVAGDLKIALDTLFNHPNVGPFIATRLIEQLVTSNPGTAYVSRVAAAFNNNGKGVRGDMAAVVKAVLLDPEARSLTSAATPYYGKLREPLIRVSTWARAFGATSQSGNWLITSTAANTSLAQAPLASPTVFNFYRPGYIPPSTTELGRAAMRSPEFQIVDEVTAASYVNVMLSWVDAGIGSTPPGGSGRDVLTSYDNEVLLADNPDALADRLDLLLFAGTMSPDLRTQIIAAVNAISITTPKTPALVAAAKLSRVKAAVFLATVAPEFVVQR